MSNVTQDAWVSCEINVHNEVELPLCQIIHRRWHRMMMINVNMSQQFPILISSFTVISSYFQVFRELLPSSFTGLKKS